MESGRRANETFAEIGHFAQAVWIVGDSLRESRAIRLTDTLAGAADARHSRSE
jgi:hypothetical protein